jgi:hypothetical protein
MGIQCKQFDAEIDSGQFWSVLTSAVAVMCPLQWSCQILLRFQLPAKRVWSKVRQCIQRTLAAAVSCSQLGVVGE